MSSIDHGPLVLGGGPFGWTTDEQTSFRVLDAFIDAGGRAIDTADSYSTWVEGNSGGESETIIGNWLSRRGNRDSLVLSTKVSGHPDHPGLGGSNIHAALHESLRRLKTDHVDVYYAHRDDPQTPQEEYLAAFDALVSAGKVREIGASEFTPARLRSAHDLATAQGLTTFTLSQDEWNLLERDIELDKLSTLETLGIAEVPFQALATGFLTGKYRPGVTPDTARAGFVKPYHERPYVPQLLNALDDIASTHHVSVAAVAIAWLRDQDAVAAPITSARKPEQLPALLESMTLSLPADTLAELSAITDPTT